MKKDAIGSVSVECLMSVRADPEQNPIDHGMRDGLVRTISQGRNLPMACPKSAVAIDGSTVSTSGTACERIDLHIDTSRLDGFYPSRLQIIDTLRPAALRAVLIERRLRQRLLHQHA